MNINRTNRRRLTNATDAAAKAVASWAEFLAANRVLLLFSLIFLLGALLGVMVYALSDSKIIGELGTLLEVRTLVGGIKGSVSALFASCFSTMLLLALLFLFGLSVCGAPFAAVVPLFFGMGMGLTEAYYCAIGFKGFMASALLIIPHYLIAGIALLFGSMESIRMSLMLSRQILPGGGMGGMWHDFKMYCVRFLVYMCLAFASGVIDVCLRLLLGALLLS